MATIRSTGVSFFASVASSMCFKLRLAHLNYGPPHSSSPTIQPQILQTFLHTGMNPPPPPPLKAPPPPLKAASDRSLVRSAEMPDIRSSMLQI